jgi:hypothetical protein
MRVLNSFGSRMRMRGLLNHWVEFRVLAMSYGGKKTLTTLAEKDFLKLKGKLAADLEWLSSILPMDRAEDIRSKVDAVMMMIQTHHSLPYEDDEEPWNAEEFDKDWHEHFIFLNRLKGMELDLRIEPGKKQMASMPGAVAPKLSKPKRLVIVKSLPVFSAIFVIILVVLIGKAFGLKSGVDGIVLEPPKSLGEAGGNLIQFGQDFWMQVQGFLEPIVVTYGPLWTAILLTLLLTAFSVLAFSHR